MHLWLIPAIERFHQGKAVGMQNGAAVLEGELSTQEHTERGFEKLDLFRQALKDFDWLMLPRATRRRSG